MADWRMMGDEKKIAIYVDLFFLSLLLSFPVFHFNLNIIRWIRFREISLVDLCVRLTTLIQYMLEMYFNAIA